VFKLIFFTKFPVPFSGLLSLIFRTTSNLSLVKVKKVLLCGITQCYLPGSLIWRFSGLLMYVMYDGLSWSSEAGSKIRKIPIQYNNIPKYLKYRKRRNSVHCCIMIGRQDWCYIVF